MFLSEIEGLLTVTIIWGAMSKQQAQEIYRIRKASLPLNQFSVVEHFCNVLKREPKCI